MVNKDEIILYKTKHKQMGRKHNYKIYMKNHPDIPKEVEYSGPRLLRNRKRLSGTNTIITYQENKESRSNSGGKRIQQNSF